MQLKTSDVGHYVRTLWDDVGARDGIITDISDDRKVFRFLPFFGKETESCGAEQVLKVGNVITASASTGL